MSKTLTFIIAASVALTAGVANAKSAKHAKKTHAAHVARPAAPAYRGTEKFPAGPIIYNDGTYLGNDPDPFIRSQIWRDIGARFGGPE